jgi:hypothetical protein
MKYISCSWLHKNTEYPIMLLSELDNENYETRKIELYLDGKYGYADKTRSFNGTELGEKPVPEVREINLSTEFHCIYISYDIFDEYWTKYAAISNEKNKERKDIWLDNGTLCIIVHGKYFDPIEMSEEEALDLIKIISTTIQSAQQGDAPEPASRAR